MVRVILKSWWSAQRMKFRKLSSLIRLTNELRWAPIILSFIWNIIYQRWLIHWPSNLFVMTLSKPANIIKKPNLQMIQILCKQIINLWNKNATYVQIIKLTLTLNSFWSFHVSNAFQYIYDFVFNFMDLECFVL